MLTKDKFIEICEKLKDFENLKDNLRGILNYDSAVFEFPALVIDDLFESLLTEEGYNAFLTDFYINHLDYNKIWDNVKEFII